jgi:hypothetical protein
VVRLLGLCVIAAAGLLLSADEVSGTTFSPQWQASVSDATPGASATLTVELRLSAPDSNFYNLVSFIPAEFGITNGDAIPNGAFSGRVIAAATLGLINDSCSNNLNVDIQLMDASLDPEYSIPLYYGVTDGNGNGLPDNVDYFPSVLSLISPDLVPVQRLYGQIPVAGVIVPLNFVIYPPGSAVPLHPAFEASLGYPTVTILGDPFAVPEPNYPVTDFCSPLLSTVRLDGVSSNNPATTVNEAGQVLRTNPAQPGVYNTVIFARSRWDTDNDGIENQLDPCPLVADPTWNPRSNTGPGDADYDGLPDTCDPDDASPNSDQDGDQHYNRLDLCPTFLTSFAHYDEDRDGIGDECDPFPTDDTNGGAAHRHALCVADTITIGSPPGGPPAYTCPSGPDLVIPPRLRLFPDNSYAIAGTVHSAWATARRLGAQDPAVAYTVSFSVTGANTASGTCLTNNYGECAFNYLGANEGVDTITASVSIDGFDLVKTVTNNVVGPPPNDAFAAAAAISVLPFENPGVPLAATEEPGEPNPCGPLSNTVWYSFTPAGDVLVTAEVETSAGPAGLAVYTGSALGGLTLLQCDSTYSQSLQFHAEGFPDHHWEEYVAFRALAGVTYLFQVGPQYGLYSDPVMTFRIEQSVMGDVNCTGTLNALDALGVLRKSAGLAAPACSGNGDMNCDGNQNSIDALFILRVSAGLMPQPTACP